ncbi:MAG: phytoene/squalene synthase family protein [Polyangiales bacterium]
MKVSLPHRTRARASIEQHSKSFSLASRLLPPKVGHDAVVLYAYCRRADDLIDLCTDGEPAAQLAQLRSELDGLYAGEPQTDPVLAEVARVLHARAIPRAYLDELLLGMEMDVHGARYRSLPDLLLYAYRVAGTVGLMMCHVMGVRHAAALRHAAHLGIAMQLTNIARDVHEDWARGRLYLPESWLPQLAVASFEPGVGPLPLAAAEELARATERLLDCAEAYYRSGDAGLGQLSVRCGFSIRAARLVYSEIGARVRAQRCDPFAPRAVVSLARKLELVGRAALDSAKRLPHGLRSPRPDIPVQSITEPESVFAVA